MPACRKGSKNNLRSDKQIQFKVQKEQIGLEGTKVHEEWTNLFGGKMRREKGKEEQS